jgi:drug/metabolite transporter (DMT)-like permease
MTIHSFYIGLSQFMLPLPVTHTISCSGTIFIFIIDYFMNGTVINKTQLLGIIVGLVGVLLTSNGRVLT